MGYAEDKFMDYLRKHLTLLKDVGFNELLVPLSACLTLATVERLNTYVKNQGNRSTLLDFYLDLSRSDDWVNHLINALQYCEYKELATRFLNEYSSYQPRSLASSPRSLPPSLSNQNQRPPQENPQCASSLPGPMPASSQETQPGPSPKPMQPGREMGSSSASGHNHEFRSLPPLAYDPPAPPRAALNHSVSEPIQPDRRTLGDERSRNPVPETSPYLAAPSEGDAGASQKVPETGTYSPTSGDRGTDDGRGRPALDERDALQPQAANHQEQPVSPARDHSIRETVVSEVYHGAQSTYLAAANHQEQPASYPPAHSIRETSVSRVEHDAQPGHQAAANPSEQPASPPPARSVRRKVVSTVEHDAHPVHPAAANHPLQPAPPPPAPSVRERRVFGAQPSAQPGAQSGAQPGAQPSAQPGAQSGAQPGAQPAHQPVFPVSSCRPLQNDNDEAYFSKPGVLFSAEGLGDATSEDGALSETSKPVLQISYSMEGNESSNSSHRSTHDTRRNVPPVSPPNNPNMQIRDSRSPEENDFMFANTSTPYKSSPGGNRSLSKQPEENSFGSRGVSRHRLDFNEGPEADLMAGNHDGVRNRPRKIPNPNQTSDQSMEETCSNGRDLERKLLITITAVSVCLSVYLLWKRHN